MSSLINEIKRQQGIIDTANNNIRQLAKRSFEAKLNENVEYVSENDNGLVNRDNIYKLCETLDHWSINISVCIEHIEKEDQ